MIISFLVFGAERAHTRANALVEPSQPRHSQRARRLRLQRRLDDLAPADAALSAVAIDDARAPRRETAEEAGATVRIHDDSLYTLFNLPSINQVYLFFRAELATPEFEAGAESLEVALFSESQIPWSEIAFPVVRTTIECFLKDRPRGFFPVRMFDVQHGADRSISTHLISQSLTSARD